MYNDLMGHWFSLLRENIYSIRYEEIVQDLVKQSKDLLDYCDLEWEEACLNFHQPERDVRTASAVQVRQPIYSSSIEIIEQFWFFGLLFSSNRSTIIFPEHKRKTSVASAKIFNCIFLLLVPKVVYVKFLYHQYNILFDIYKIGINQMVRHL